MSNLYKSYPAHHVRPTSLAWSFPRTSKAAAFLLQAPSFLWLLDFSVAIA